MFMENRQCTDHTQRTDDTEPKTKVFEDDARTPLKGEKWKRPWLCTHTLRRHTSMFFVAEPVGKGVVKHNGVCFLS